MTYHFHPTWFIAEECTVEGVNLKRLTFFALGLIFRILFNATVMYCGCWKWTQKPNSWTMRFLCTILRLLRLLRFPYTMLHYKPVSNHCCSKGEGEGKIVGRGDVNSKEENPYDSCPNYVQKFGPWSPRSLKKSAFIYSLLTINEITICLQRHECTVQFQLFVWLNLKILSRRKWPMEEANYYSFLKLVISG